MLFELALLSPACDFKVQSLDKSIHRWGALPFRRTIGREEARMPSRTQSCITWSRTASYKGSSVALSEMAHKPPENLAFHVESDHVSLGPSCRHIRHAVGPVMPQEARPGKVPNLGQDSSVFALLCQDTAALPTVIPVVSSVAGAHCPAFSVK
jgi:hypothetical protein